MADAAAVPEAPARRRRLFAAMLTVSGLGALDYVTGPDLAFSLFYLLPVAATAWRSGAVDGMAVGFIASAIWVGADLAWQTHDPWVRAWNGFTRLAIFAGFAAVLGRARDAQVRLARLNAELNVIAQRAAAEARTDPVTHLPNARTFRELMTSEIARAKRLGEPFCVAVVQVPMLEAACLEGAVAAPDVIANATAHALRGSIRATDHLARLGSSSFGVLFWHVSPEDAHTAAERISARLQALGTPGRCAESSATVGVAYFTAPPDDPDEAVRRAESAASAAERRGDVTVGVWCDVGALPRAPRTTPSGGEALVAPSGRPATPSGSAEPPSVSHSPTQPELSITGASPDEVDPVFAADTTPGGAISTEKGPTLLPGARVGRYEVLREIARGGMGVVYLVRDGQDGRDLALKLMLRPQSPKERVRFEREAQAAGRLRHPNVCAIKDAGEHEGLAYFVMEYVPGEPLDRYVRSQGLDVRGVATVLAKVCAGVAHAHQRGVIHRDLKPSNVVVDPQGEPRVMDFGIARDLSVESSGDKLTTDGIVLGTVGYMSPEQLAGSREPADVRSDVYALGVILYELLVGRPPFEGSGLQVLYQVINSPAPRPRAHVPSLDEDVDAITAKALEPDPRARYQSAAELSADLERFLAGLPVVAARSSIRYVARRFVTRHRAAVVTGLVAAAAFVAFALVAQIASLRSVGAMLDEAESSLTRARAALDERRDEDADAALRAALSRASEALDMGGPTLRARAAHRLATEATVELALRTYRFFLAAHAIDGLAKWDEVRASELREEAAAARERRASLLQALDEAEGAYARGSLVEAQAAYERALVIDKLSADARFGLAVCRGQAATRRGDAAAARAALLEAVTAAPTPRARHEARALLAAHEGR